MKGIGTRLLLFVTCFSLCLALAAPVRAIGDAPLTMTRADKSLLQSNVASLWKLHVRIGSARPADLKQQETFGLVKNGQLSPAFVAQAVLQLSLRDEDTPHSQGPEWQAAPRPADVPRRYDLCIPLRQLEMVARQWLGWPLEVAALSWIDGVLRKGDCLYVDTRRLLNTWPCPMYDPREHDIFAQPFKTHAEQDRWIMQGEVWDIQQGQGGLDVNVCGTFSLTVKKVDGHWRILSLDFGRSVVLQ